MVAVRANPAASAAAIFARLWEGEDGLSRADARRVLKLGFSAADQGRMHELAGRSRAGTLTAAERDELDNYVKVGDLLAIVQSKARRVLKSAVPARSGHG